MNQFPIPLLVCGAKTYTDPKTKMSYSSIYTLNFDDENPNVLGAIPARSRCDLVAFEALPQDSTLFPLRVNAMVTLRTDSEGNPIFYVHSIRTIGDPAASLPSAPKKSA
ncbi:hypothetical protein [Thalassolituus sp.]|jgi:hypothetical protein|uniref:hypothetical protein n=1 Tax=Thalassolituus sp. TaxID=2030822 RepID=UPI002A8153D4|nr:hypothetical protein [Thalassolituus sp.]